MTDRTPRELTAELGLRFWPHLAITSNGCMEWQRSRDDKGYGWIRVDGRLWRTHRVSYILTFGSIPDDLIICHRCDNPPCCNPAHLFAGTWLDNARDASVKGRTAVQLYPERYRRRRLGTTNGLAKLTEEAVREIRRRHAEGGVTQSDLAVDFGVTQTTISDIVTGATWKHVA